MNRLQTEQLFAFAKHVPVFRPSGQPAAVQNRSRRFCANQLEAKVASAKSRIDHLIQSMDSRVPALGPAAAQHRSRRFRQGERVTQAPSDELASELLARMARRGRPLRLSA